MIRLFVFLGSLLVLALMAALVVPPFVNWNQFKDRFEVEASRILGQKVEVLGQTSARLLPLPSITFQDIRVGEAQGAEALLTASSFHMDMELAPLLKGEVVVVDMSLDKPRLEMRINERGAITFAENVKKPAADFAAADISIDRIKITDGVLRFRDESQNDELIVKDIDLNASARTLSGPWSVDGALSYLEKRVHVAGTAGRLQEVGEQSSKMTVRFTARPKFLPYDLEFDGPFSLEYGVPRLEGSFRVKPMKPQGVQERLSFERVSGGNTINGSVQGLVRLTAKGGIVPEFKLDIGKADDPYSVSGSAFANFGEEVSFEVKADGQQINIARLAATEDGSNAAPRNLQERLAIVREVLEKVPRFKANGKVSLRLPAVIAGDTVIRDVEVEARPLTAAPGWRLERLQAQLPGRTEVRADGVLRLGDRFGYEGALVLASRQPSGFAAWLTKDIPPAIRSLSNAGVSATAKLTGRSVQLDDLEIVLDGNQLKGLFRRDEGADGENGLITAKLAGEEVNYDQLAALFDLFAGNQTGNARHDLAVAVDAERLRAFGFNANKVKSKFTLADGVLDIENLSVGALVGAEISAIGKLTGFPAKAQGQVSGYVKSGNPAKLLGELQKRFGPYPVLDRLIADPALVSETDLAFEVTSGKENATGAIAIKVGGFAGGSTVDFNGSAAAGDTPLKQRRLIASLKLANGDGAKLLSQLGVPVLPVTSAGAGRVSMGFDGMVEKTVETFGELNVAGLSGSAVGNLKPGFKDGLLSADGDLAITAKADDFDPLILLSGLPVPGFGNGYKGEVAFTLGMAGKRISAKNIIALTGGSAWRGNLDYDGATSPRPALSGSLSVDEVYAASVVGMVHTGGSGESSAPAAAPLLAGIDGKIAFDAGTVFLGGQSQEAKNLIGKMVLRNGNIGLEDFAATWLGGKVSGDVSLGQTSAARTINGQVRLENADFGGLTKAIGYAVPLQGKVTLSGNFEGAGKDADALTKGLTGSGSASISDGQIGGLNEAALAQILKIADDRGSTTETMSKDELTKAGLFDGPFNFSGADAVISVASGVARANNVRLMSKSSSLALSSKLDLGSFAFNANARMSYDAGREAVVGASPGISIDVDATPGEIKRTIDVSSLTTFLGMRAAEQKEREFESQKANILERQRLQRTVRLYNLQDRQREQEIEAKRKEEERLRLEREKEAEQLRLKKEADENRAKEEEAKRSREAQLKQAEDLNADSKPARPRLELKGFDAIKPKVLDSLRNRVRDSLSLD